MNARSLLALVGLIVASTAGHAQLTIPSDGSDGALVLGYNNPGLTIDLGQAVPGTWNTPSPNAGKGVYDPFQWAVVYKYSSVNIAGADRGSRVSFTPHPSGAPVVWLVDGDVNIGGNMELFMGGGGSNGLALSLPGPGGFRGGAGVATLEGSAGFGPGGGNYLVAQNDASGGSFATAGTIDAGPTYGNAQCIPLIGGSGGSGTGAASTFGGGAGGGAILIAAKGTITINGSIYAAGGSGYLFNYTRGGGSGGAIRLVANTINVPGGLFAQGASGGGQGRIRIEANTVNVTGQVTPVPSSVIAALTPQIWPLSTAPKLEIVQVGTQNAPLDPRANLLQPDVPMTTSGNKTVTVRAYNVPTDGTWAVQVRMTPRNGKETYATCTFSSGNQALSLWQCTLNFDTGSAALISRAYKL
jgi:hypothetical protein